MDKILVEVNIPAAHKKYDLYLPKKITVYEAKQIMIKLFNELSEGLYYFDKRTVLCDFATGKVVDEELVVGLSGMDNGTKLMIV